jgi:hypothetical protein
MTPLDKTLKRLLRINGRDYVITLTPDALKITRKGHRLGVELKWPELVSGESALAVALHASIGKFQDGLPPVAQEPKGIARRRAKSKANAAISRRVAGKRIASKRLRI